MVSKKVSDGWLLRAEKGEQLMRSLQSFCEEQDIRSGIISGLGGALWAELAFYHLDQKAYEFDRIDEPLEISNLSGNISSVNEKPFLHVHATVADMNYHSYAGHLKELEVGGTCEVYIKTFPEPVSRVHNDEIGLKLLDL